MVIAFTRHKGFGRDQAGNVGVIFALALLPLLSLGGAALDYTRFTSERAKLQQATDAAALQAVLVNVSSNQERINEAKAVVAQYHKYLADNSLIRSVVDETVSLPPPTKMQKIHDA